MQPPPCKHYSRGSAEHTYSTRTGLADFHCILFATAVVGRRRTRLVPAPASWQFECSAAGRLVLSSPRVHAPAPLAVLVASTMSAQQEYRPTSPFPIHWLMLGGAATYMLSKRPEKGIVSLQLLKLPPGALASQLFVRPLLPAHIACVLACCIRIPPPFARWNLPHVARMLELSPPDGRAIVL